MSTINQTLTLQPFESGKNETFTFHGFCCPYCNGRKEFVKQIGYEQYETTTCSLCCGRGKLQAKIIVGWSPED